MMSDFDDSYKVYTHGAGTHDLPIYPFKTRLSDFLGLDINSIRTDKYTTEHDGKHILFAGCSVTHGVGLPDTKDCWTDIVYNKITKDEKVSGFFSLAYPGHSITLQVSLIMRYIAEYGKPDVIFFNLPSTSRSFVADNDQLYLSQITDHQETEMPGSTTLAAHTSFESYLTLHEYCRLLGIRLISFTWSDKPSSSDPGVTADLFKDKFDSFYISKVKVEDFLLDYLMNYQVDYALLGTDDQHPGIALHAYYASIALDAYLDFPA